MKCLRTFPFPGINVFKFQNLYVRRLTALFALYFVSNQRIIFRTFFRAFLELCQCLRLLFKISEVLTYFLGPKSRPNLGTLSQR